MAAVYSTRFVDGNTGAGDLVYPVPAGFRAVVVDINVYNNSAIVAELFAQVQLTGQTFARFDVTGPSDSGSKQWQGRAVFDYGDALVFHASAGTWDVLACGYLLTLP
jgi:hypothetical protein